MFTSKAILITLGSGVLCYYIAKNRGFKNPLIWGVAGIFGSVLVILLVSFIKKKNAENNK